MPQYEYETLASMGARLDTVMRLGTALRNERALAALLEEACVRNYGGIDNEQLYSQTRSGTKQAVEAHVSKVLDAIHALSSSHDHCEHSACAKVARSLEGEGEAPAEAVAAARALHLDLGEKAALFGRLRQTWGETALCLVRAQR